MFRKMLKGKIHRATVTGADLHYVGSITIDSDLLEGAGIVAHEAVDIYNITNGERFETYVIAGPRGSGQICVNGAAAHMVSEGDLIIIACYAFVEDKEVASWEPKLVFADGANKIAKSMAA